MRLLAWVLVHFAGTVTLAGLARQIREELQLRARCGALGQPSPRQLLER